MASSVRSRKFFCCLPVRLGVISLALLAMVGGSFVAGISFIQISGLSRNPLEKSDEIALWIQAIMYAILGIVGILGFIGALVKNRPMISSFAFVLAIHLGFSVASGLFTIYTMFTRDSSSAVNQCVASAADQGTVVSQADCQNGITVMKGVMVGVYVITWLIQLYAYFIVERYADQLEDEELADHIKVVPRTLPEISPPLTQVSTYSGYGSSYPFLDQNQAFGSSRHHDRSNMV